MKTYSKDVVLAMASTVEDLTLDAGDILNVSAEMLRAFAQTLGEPALLDPMDSECSPDPNIRMAFADGYDTGYAHGQLKLGEPVAVPDAKPITYPVSTHSEVDENIYARGWNACRQAVLSGKTHVPDGCRHVAEIADINGEALCAVVDIKTPNVLVVGDKLYLHPAAAPHHQTMEKGCE